MFPVVLFVSGEKDMSENVSWDNETENVVEKENRKWLDMSLYGS